MNNKHIKTCLANKEAGNKYQRLMGMAGAQHMMTKKQDKQKTGRPEHTTNHYNQWKVSNIVLVAD